MSSVFAQTREVRSANNFTKISFRVPGKLYLRQGNTFKVEIEGKKEVLDEIETDVEGSRLVIETDWKKWKWNDDDRVNVYITAPAIEALHVSGSGDLIAETKINATNVELNVSGSGSIKAEIEASGTMHADVSGSGNITVRGKSKDLNSRVSGSGHVTVTLAVSSLADFSVSGSGRIEASGSASAVKTNISGSGKVLAANLETNKCDVRISGSGDVEINVKEELDANISGSGSVTYKGDPKKLNSHASGSGKVRKM